MNTRSGVIAAAYLMLWLTDTGRAYWASGPHWPSSTTIVMHLQQGSPSGALMDGNADWDTVTEGAVATWNPFLSGASFRVVKGSTASIALRNNTNNVVWADDVYGQPFGDAVAVTQWLYYTSDNRMAEADVMFDRSRNWNSYRGNTRRGSDGGNLLDLRRAALHEFGHVLGLGHPNDHGQSVSAIMNSRLSNLDSLQEDDTNGASSIYGSTTTPAPVSPPAPRTRDTLLPGGRLTSGQSLTSATGRYRLAYQGDGNLVLYDDIDRVALWASNTGGTTAGQALMQADGNFVIYSAQGAGLWGSGTTGNANARVVVQNDGSVVVYRADGQPIWSAR